MNGLPPSDDSSPAATERQARIEDLLFTHLQARLQGEDIDDQQLLDQYPELLPELAEQLRVLRDFDDQRDASAAVETASPGSGELTVPGDFVGVLTDYANANKIGGLGVPGLANLTIDLTKNPGFTTAYVPEPTTFGLLALGGFGLAVRRLGRKA